MKLKFTGFFVALIAAFAFSTVSFAQDIKPAEGIQPPPPMEHGAGRFGQGDRMRGRHHGGHDGLTRAFSELNLSDSQKQQVNSIVETNKTNNQVQRDELKQLMMTRRNGTALTPEQETRAQELGSQLRESNKKMHADLMAILTPEQQQQLQLKHEEMRQKMQERRQIKQQNGDTTSTPPNK